MASKVPADAVGASLVDYNWIIISNFSDLELMSNILKF